MTGAYARCARFGSNNYPLKNDNIRSCPKSSMSTQTVSTRSDQAHRHGTSREGMPANVPGAGKGTIRR